MGTRNRVQRKQRGLGLRTEVGFEDHVISVSGLVAFIGSFTYMSISSRKVRQNGLVNGLLRFCPGTPNCVVSENSDKESYIEPFAYSGNPASAWERARIGIIDLGGRIENDTGGYLW